MICCVCARLIPGSYSRTGDITLHYLAQPMHDANITSSVTA